MASLVPVDNDPFSSGPAQPPGDSNQGPQAQPPITQPGADSIQPQGAVGGMPGAPNGNAEPSLGDQPPADKNNVPQGNSPSLIPVDHDPFAAPKKASGDNENSIGEQATRQVGLTARDYLGVVPKAITGLADSVNAGVNLASTGINKVTGSNIPMLRMDMTKDVDKGLSAAGLPEAQTPTEKGVHGASDLALSTMLGGEDGVNTIKEGATNLYNATAKPLAQGVSNIGKGIKALNTQGLQDAVASEYSKVHDMYTDLRNQGVGYTQEKSDAIKNDIQNALQKSGIIPRERQVSTSVVNDMMKDTEGRPLDLSELDQYRSSLGQASGRDSVAAKAVRDAIDKHTDPDTINPDDITNGTPRALQQLQQARAASSRTFALDDFANILTKAKGNPTLIKNKINAWLADDSNFKGFQPEEIAAIRDAGSTSGGEKVLGMLGRFGFDFHPSNPTNTLIPFLAATAARESVPLGVAATGVGKPLVAAGTGARSAQTYLSRGKAQNAFDTIRNRAIPGVDDAPPPNLQLPPPDIRPPPGGFGTVNYNPGQRALDSPDVRRTPPRQLGFTPRPDFSVDSDGVTESIPAPFSSIRQNNGAFNDAKQSTKKTASRSPQKLLTYQPRPDFIGTDNGINQATPNGQVGDFSLGDAAAMPIGTPGELQSIRGNPRYEQHKRGGKVKQGRVYSAPKSYPALERSRRA